MKLTKDNIKIGDRIQFSKCYPTTCSERFPTDYQTDIRSKEPNPITILVTTGIVIGLRMAIMENYSYTKGYSSKGFEDPYPDYVSAYARGKSELIIVCVKGIRGSANNPFYVRFQDVIES